MDHYVRGAVKTGCNINYSVSVDTSTCKQHNGIANANVLVILLTNISSSSHSNATILR